MEGAKLRRIALVNAHLEGARLAGADFREANLEGTYLTGASGFQAEKFAGARIAGAQLPDEVSNFDGVLAWVAEASVSARKTLALTLVACLYCWLTIVTTSAEDRLTLPVISAEISVPAFYYVAPVLLLGMSLYLQVYLQRLWEVLSGLPAVFPDGRPLERRAYPWIVNGIVGKHFKHLRERRPPYAWLQSLSSLVAWWTVPITLWVGFLFTGSRRIDDVMLNTSHGVLTRFAVVSAVLSQRLARRTLRGELWERLWESRDGRPGQIAPDPSRTGRIAALRGFWDASVSPLLQATYSHGKLLVGTAALIAASVLLTAGDTRVGRGVQRGLASAWEATRAEILEIADTIANGD